MVTRKGPFDQYPCSDSVSFPNGKLVPGRFRFLAQGQPAPTLGPVDVRKSSPVDPCTQEDNWAPIGITGMHWEAVHQTMGVPWV